MRVLVVTAPLLEHTYPLVPLAWELRTAGHEVLLATTGEAVRVADSGLPVADVARHFDMGRTMRRMALRNPMLAAERAGRAGPRGVVTLFGEINDDIADGAVTLGDQWRPDLVVYGALAPVGALVAARAGVPAVLCDYTLADGERLSFAATGHLSYACGRHSVNSLPSPAAVIRLAPTSLVGDRPGWPMRHVPYDGGLATPDWLSQPPAQPRIAVVRSTPGDRDGALMGGSEGGTAGRPAHPGGGGAGAPDLGVGGPLPDNVRTVSGSAGLAAAHLRRGGAPRRDRDRAGCAAARPAATDRAGRLERRRNAALVHTRRVGLVGSRRGDALPCCAGCSAKSGSRRRRSKCGRR